MHFDPGKRTIPLPRGLMIPAFLSLLLILACSGKRADRPNVLLVTFDTLRADHLACYGYGRIETPAIDRLAAEGILFESAYAPVPITLPSHTSLLTGLYPHQHGVRDNGVYRLGEETETAAEILRDAGYATAAFVGAHVLDHSYRIDQGFELYDDEMEEALITDSPIKPGAQVPDYTRRWVESWTQPFQRKAQAVAGRAIAWLRARDNSRPYFCWVHFFDPHTSYAPPEPWAGLYGAGYDGPVDGTPATFSNVTKNVDAAEYQRHHDQMIALYDGEISYADHWLGMLLEEITENTLVIFLSDHGEAFGEHGQLFEHGGGIFNESVHVPLILAGAGVEKGVRRGEVVSTVDVLPTILDYLDLESDIPLPGRSLLGMGGSGDDMDGRAVYCETMCSRTAVPTPVCFRGVRTDAWSLIFRINKRDLSVAQTRLHNYSEDKGEVNNLYASEAEKFNELNAKYKEHLDLGVVDEKNPADFWDLTDDDPRRERLRALGYVD